MGVDIVVSLVSVIVGAVLSLSIQGVFSHREHKRQLRMIQFETLHDFTAELRVATRSFQLELSRSFAGNLGEPSEESIQRYFQVAEVGLERADIATVDEGIRRHVSSAKELFGAIEEARMSWGILGLENKGRTRMYRSSHKLMGEIESAASKARDHATR